MDNQTSKLNQKKNQDFTPRARAIIEFTEGDLSRPPVVYPATGGSDEQDEALRAEILKRWALG